MKTLLLATILVVCCAVVASQAEVFTYIVAKDNYNNSDGNTTQRGGADEDRAAKGKQEKTWYGEWSDANIADIAAKITGMLPGQTYTLTFKTATGNWGDIPPAPGAAPLDGQGNSTWTPKVSAFYSTTDWVEMEATNNKASNAAGWDGVVGKLFWSLVDVDNVAPVVGNWQTHSGGTPLVIQWNSAVLEPAVVTALLDTNCRGLRMWDEDYHNTTNCSREKWGGAAAPSLVLEIIPEPASLTLLGLGALGALIRRRR